MKNPCLAGNQAAPSLLEPRRFSYAFPLFMTALKKTIARACCVLGGARIANLVANRFERRNSRIAKFPFFARRKQRTVQILIYHRVNDDRDWSFPGTPIGVFARQMDYLASTHTVLGLEDAVERIHRNDVPENAIVVTFDDGYHDNFANAYPILRNLSLPATVFLATDVIGSDRLLWHDRVFGAFRKTKVLELSECPDKQRFSLATAGERLAAQHEVLGFLFSLDEKQRDFWIDRLIAKLKVPDIREKRGLMLSWQEIATMSRNGIAFGSHSVTHPILSKLSATRIREEIVTSKRVIEEKLGTSVTTFAYPKGGRGDFNETTKKLLIEAGYRCAVTTLFGVNKVGQDAYELRRGTPWEEDIESFALKLAWYRFAAAA
jgi:peptidoglycan/xylan/chitin deacetylase (PgdA/CDA1 family)